MKCTSCGQEFEGNFCPNCGKKAQETCSAQKPASKAAVALRIYRVPICIGAGLLALVLIAVIVICCVLGNIFRISKVARINVGDTPEQVLAVLGEPYGYDTRTQEDSTFSDRKWTYYSANYQKLLDQTKKAEAGDSGDLIEIFELEKQLEFTPYDYIEVHFTGSDDALTVLSVFFEPGRIGSGGTETTEKTVEDYEVFSDEFVLFKDSAGNVLFYPSMAQVVYAVTYTDGSYYKTQVAAYYDKDTDWQTDTIIEVHWHDRYSNEYRARLYVVVKQMT